MKRPRLAPVLFLLAASLAPACTPQPAAAPPPAADERPPAPAAASDAVAAAPPAQGLDAGPAVPDPTTAPPPAVPTSDAAAAPLRGITHEDLLRLYADAGPDAAPPDQAVEPDRPLAPDTEFTDERPAATARARYAIVLPDERVTLQTERALRVDDQGDRAAATLVGTGLPAVPGMRVLARSGLAGFALVSSDGARYRPSTPDELQRWMLGSGAPPRATLSFRRVGDTLMATRGGLSLAINAERQGDAHPLTCRTLVALFLGGDPSAARAGCADARMPVRATLRSRGAPVLSLERAEAANVELPRAALAVPPAGARPDLPLPQHADDGAFFAPSELAALGGTREPQHTLALTNGLAREALVFVDDLAIGWVAPGRTATFVGLSAGRHTVRARSLDGLEASAPTVTAFPAAVRAEPGAAVPAQPQPLQPAAQQPPR